MTPQTEIAKLNLEVRRIKPTPEAVAAEEARMDERNREAGQFTLDALRAKYGRIR